MLRCPISRPISRGTWSTGRCWPRRRAALYRTRKFLRRHRLAAFGTAAGSAFLLLSGVTVWSLAHRDSPPRPKLTDKRTIVLADFANATGDSGFDGTLRQILAAQLGNSPSLALLPDARVSQTLRLMMRPADAKLTPAVAAEICERTGSAAVVEGSITSLGSEYVLDVRARNCRTGDILDEEHVAGSQKRGRLQGAGPNGKPVRDPGRRIASQGRKGAQSARRGDHAFTGGLAVLQRGNEGRRDQITGTETRSLLKRAIEIDPKFAMAYAQLGLSDIETAAQNVAKAYELRDQVSDRENYFITFNYHRQLTSNLELARQTLESWAQKYPSEP